VSLRKSPTRTPAMLAANRANARKSTGPRTPEGKAQVALRRLLHGRYSPNFLAHFEKSPRDQAEFEGIFRALLQAILPDNETQLTSVSRTAVAVWAAKRRLERWVASPAKREGFFARTTGTFPKPSRLRIKRPGWQVTISLWLRRGRRKGPDRVARVRGGWQEGKENLHVVVTVTSSMRHPIFGYSCLEAVPEGAAPRVVFHVKPESYRKHEADLDMLTNANTDWLATFIRETLDRAGELPEPNSS